MNSQVVLVFGNYDVRALGTFFETTINTAIFSCAFPNFEKVAFVFVVNQADFGGVSLTSEVNL
jgi:hypothetical protein